MNNWDSLKLTDLPKNIKTILFLFVLTVTIGYGFSLRQLYLSVGTSTQELQEHYLGNEIDEDASIMKFKKNEKELLTFLHNHLLSLGSLLLLLTLILNLTPIHPKLKRFLSIEPFVSLLITFSCIYGLWSGFTSLKYIVSISGALFHGSFMVILVVNLYWLFPFNIGSGKGKLE